MRWLVTGAAGMLGSEAIAVLQSRGIEHLGLSHSQLDILDASAVHRVLDEYRPEIILNCAAWIDGETAELHKEQALALNCGALANFTEYTNTTDALLVNISTDYVFDGRSKVPYPVTASRNPLSAYGASKAAGEIYLLDAAPKTSLILRTSWLLGDAPRNFGRRMAERARNSEAVTVISDQHGSPTSSDELARNIVDTLSKKRIIGIHHIANDGIASRYELARAIYEVMGADANLVQPAVTGSIATNMVRPEFAVLDTTESIVAGFSPMSPWRDALANSNAAKRWRSL